MAGVAGPAAGRQGYTIVTMSAPLRNVVALVLAAICSATVLAPPTSLERRIFRCFVNGAYAEAAALIEQHLDQSPNDSAMLYNAACAYSLLGRRDEAASYLRRAVEAGMHDLAQIKRDPDLAAIRDHPTYRSLVDLLSGETAGPVVDGVSQWRALYGERDYLYDRDDQRRIDYATALDPTSYSQMRQMIERQCDQIQQTLFPGSSAPYLLIAVPTPRDAERLFSNDQTGGVYEHERRRLIARDIGGSLRHELVHAAHYAHMEQLHQRHPLWVQEGLAALYEDYRLSPDGSIVFLPNERHNITQGLARAHRLTRWSDLFAMPADKFMSRASHLYPQVRSIFEYLADQGKLSCWYDALIDNFDTDRSGALAFEVCFDRPVEQVERDWRAWVLARPLVDTSIARGDAALGVETQLNASNDGVLVTRVLPGSAAARGQLEPGDVIVAIDDQPTRSLMELRTAIAARKVGDTVSVRTRRKGAYFTVVVSLRPLEPMIW